MVFDPFDAYWLKRSVADMKGDLGDFDSCCAQAVEQLGSEVQPRGRSRYCAAFAREHSLISLGVETIFFVPFDVRRKRRAADTIDDFVEVARRFEAHYAAAAFAPLDHFSGELAACELDSPARRQSSSRLDQGFPNQRFDAAHEKDFDAPSEYRFASRSHAQPPADKPCRKDSSVVQHQQVSGAKVIRQLCEYRIDKLAARAIDHHQPRAIASRRGFLSDQVFGKIVMEIGNKHRLALDRRHLTARLVEPFRGLKQMIAMQQCGELRAEKHYDARQIYPGQQCHGRAYRAV
jgi:hypothetical protein